MGNSFCQWLCCCCQNKDKADEQLKKKTKRRKKNKTGDTGDQKSDKKPVDENKALIGENGQQIESFYDKKDDTKDKTDLDRDMVSLSETTDSNWIRTYDLPAENCHSVKDLMRHLGYELQTQVGKGGFGLVRKCIHTNKKTGKRRVLASKEITLAQQKDQKDRTLKGLRNEIFVLRKSRHPFVIGLEDAFIINSYGLSKAYLFLEFADCDTLQHEINYGPLSNSEAKRYFAQMATALAYLHRQKIAHKDLKPENILLVKNEKTGLKDVKVGDFGLSQDVYKAKEGIIKTGHFGGTRGYMAPEIIRLEVFREHRKVLALTYNPFMSDMWALGVCLFEMLTKTLPFDFHNLNNMLSLEEEKTFTYPRAVRDSIDADADDLIRRLLEPDFNKRIDPLGVLTHPWIAKEVDLSLIKITETPNQS